MKNNIRLCALLFGLGLALVNYPVMAAGKHGHAHGHRHDDHSRQSEQARQASQGIFEDKDVRDRRLADWSGIWQSVNPYLLSGDLDPVLQEKVKNNKDKTFAEYRDYYRKGYATGVSVIRIKDDAMEFLSKDAVSSCPYRYSGYRILTYKSGKKGVRYLFECQDKNSGAPKYVQFSDHIIEPARSGHFHIYMGDDSHERLLEQMDNWPTFYPISLDRNGIVAEMLSH